MAHNLLTRRRLIGAVGLGMAGIVSGPLRAAVKPAFRWQDEAAGAAAPIAAACVNHPFVRGLADGSLSEERFLYYLGQNIHYLDLNFAPSVVPHTLLSTTSRVRSVSIVDLYTMPTQAVPQ